MSAVDLHTAGQIHDIRSRLAAAGAEMKPSTDMQQIARVLALVGDPDLTVDAILMDPRPAWLVVLIGLDFWVAPAKPAPKQPRVWHSGPDTGARPIESD